MRQPAYTLTAAGREVVLGAIRDVCAYRDWRLAAANVRSTHVHVVVDGSAVPEQMLHDFKAYSSRALNRLESTPRTRWTRHGSTRWLNTPATISAAMHYVLEEQGPSMAVFPATAP